MRISHILTIVGVMAALAGPARAQQPTKPGGLNAVAHNVSNTVKKAGRDTKQGVKHVASQAHQSLKSAGRRIKGALHRATGITSQSHQPGGLNKVARNVSRASKKLGSQVKHLVRSGRFAAHHQLKKAGNKVKASLRGGG